MNLGTPRRLIRAAGPRRAAAPEAHDPAPRPDPVERVVVVDEPAVPNHPGHDEGAPARPGPQTHEAAGSLVPDDASELIAGRHDEPSS